MQGLVYISLVIFCLYGSTYGMRWADCGSTKGKVKSAMVGGCEKMQTCDLHRGANATFTVEFTPNEKITKATAVVHGILLGVPIPFPIDCPIACNGCGLKCPVPSGTDTVYKLNIFVKPSYPSVKVTVKFELKDPDNKDIFCIEVPAEVV